MDQMQPDLDWEFSERHEPPARVVTRHEPKRAALGGAILLACGCLFILAACAIVSHAAGVAKYRPVAEDAVAELAAAQDTAAQAIDNAEYWQAQALEASATIEALASEVASLTAGYESMRIQVEDLELLNRALKNELGAKITPQSAPKAPAAPKQTSATTSTAGWQSATVSWYGPGFIGNKTASGAVLTAGMMNVAGHGFTFGTRIEFEYKGRTAVAVFNDRGPWVRSGGKWVPHPTRKFDLGPGTAAALGFSGVGTVKWRVVS